MHFLHLERPGEVGKVILMTDPQEENPDDCRVLNKPFNGQELLSRIGRI